MRCLRALGDDSCQCNKCTELIVVRAAVGLPQEARDKLEHAKIEGRWYRVAKPQYAMYASDDGWPEHLTAGWVARRTKRYELNEAGQAARVFEVHP